MQASSFLILVGGETFVDHLSDIIVSALVVVTQALEILLGDIGLTLLVVAVGEEQEGTCQPVLLWRTLSDEGIELLLRLLHLAGAEEKRGVADVAFSTVGSIEVLEQGLIGLHSLAGSTRSLFALTLDEEELSLSSCGEVATLQEALGRSGRALVVLRFVGCT